MRETVFHLKEWYMTTERPEDFELVRDYVVEQTRKVSMEQLGVDLTQQGTGDFQQGFTIEKRRVGQVERLRVSESRAMLASALPSVSRLD
jgi:hypothetical protein